MNTTNKLPVSPQAALQAIQSKKQENMLQRGALAIQFFEIKFGNTYPEGQRQAKLFQILSEINELEAEQLANRTLEMDIIKQLPKSHEY
jgi:hypothetical protein